MYSYAQLRILLQIHDVIYSDDTTYYTYKDLKELLGRVTISAFCEEKVGTCIDIPKQAAEESKFLLCKTCSEIRTKYQNSSCSEEQDRIYEAEIDEHYDTNHRFKEDYENLCNLDKLELDKLEIEKYYKVTFLYSMQTEHETYVYCDSDSFFNRPNSFTHGESVYIKVVGKIINTETIIGISEITSTTTEKWIYEPERIYGYLYKIINENVIGMYSYGYISKLKIMLEEVQPTREIEEHIKSAQKNPQKTP